MTSREFGVISFFIGVAVTLLGIMYLISPDGWGWSATTLGVFLMIRNIRSFR